MNSVNDYLLLQNIYSLYGFACFTQNSIYLQLNLKLDYCNIVVFIST